MDFHHWILCRYLRLWCQKIDDDVSAEACSFFIPRSLMSHPYRLDYLRHSGEYQLHDYDETQSKAAHAERY